MSDGEHLEISVCQCGGGVPDPRHSAAGEEGGASAATLTAHVFFGHRPCCLGVLLRRCCVSVWWWVAWSSTHAGEERGGGVGHHQQDSPLIVPWALDGIHVASCHISPFPEKGAGCTLGDGKYLEVVVCQEEERSVKASSCCHRSVEPAASSYCVRTFGTKQRGYVAL